MKSPCVFSDLLNSLLPASNISFMRFFMFYFLLGTNRFEVTLEKSNKNFSKKIQQVDKTFALASVCHSVHSAQIKNYEALKG